MLKFKILFVNSSLSGGGGASKSTYYVFENLKKYFDVELCLLHKSKNRFVEGEKDIFYLRHESSRTKNVYLRYYNFLFDAYHLNKLQKERQYDMIITSQSQANFVGKVLKFFKRDIPLWSIHRSARPQHKSFIKRKLVDLSSKLDKYPDKIITVSKSLEKDRRKYLPNQDIITIYNPFDLKNIQKQKLEDLESNFERKFFNENKVLINVGRLARQKNQLLLLQVFKELKKEFPKLKLAILGEGPKRKQLEEYIEENNLQGEVYMPGIVNNVFKYLDRSDIFLFPSRYEGFGRVIVEAMACELPIISSNYPYGASELINETLYEETNIKGYKKCKYGYLVERFNKKAYVEITKKLLNNKTLQKEITKKSKKRAKSFDKKVIGKEWKELIESEFE